ncbi:TRAP transporter substrate-binding protein [Marinobacterium lutimaris]|uniref:TRAP-type C4-dicarboxylate transport system, substrate-binding protein n=1 Tax=Marinobacterium lutimaris TaxID=568106 RepID=A0A1H5VN44_9GAMM|nr:TRAP transporter substrate-binding protein [Marinobacterium lutimaris]SEF88650.1 TRAP-type C4-dicarboxylate transport system, substrate-binding protein [Marinobacterium lutimaris]
MTPKHTSCLAGAILSVFACAANAETTLRFAHLWPQGSEVNMKIFEPWAKAVEEQSGGELKVEIYPSQTLVKSSSAYDSTVQGITDISATLQGYTAGRFPLSEIVQLPGISSSATQGACILQSLYDDGSIAAEYKDTHPLFLFTTGPAYIHTRTAEIQSPSDLSGMQVRKPSEVAGEMLSNMGAQPVGMPAPDLYAAVQRGVVEGLSLPWEAMKVFRINDLTSHHLEIPYYTGAIMATMSQRSYNALSPELQAVIDANSGMLWSKTAGEVFQDLDRQGREEAVAAGHTFGKVEDPMNDPEWSEPLKTGIESYLSRLESRGFENARAIYQKALEYQQGCAS